MGHKIIYHRKPFTGNAQPTIINRNKNRIFIHFVEITPSVLYYITQDIEEASFLCDEITSVLYDMYNGHHLSKSIDNYDSYDEQITMMIKGKYQNLILQIQLGWEANLYFLRVITAVV